MTLICVQNVSEEKEYKSNDEDYCTPSESPGFRDSHDYNPSTPQYLPSPYYDSPGAPSPLPSSPPIEVYNSQPQKR